MAQAPRSNWSSWLLPDNFFGFKVGKKPKNLKSFATPENQDGTTNIEVGGAYGTYYDMQGSFKNEAELITKYREMANQPECDAAIEDIINEAIVRKFILNLFILKICYLLKQKLMRYLEDGMLMAKCIII